MERRFVGMILFVIAAVVVSMLCAFPVYAEGEEDIPQNKWAAKGKTVRVRYITAGGEKIDVRSQADKALKKYNIGQGACSDGMFIYMAFEMRRDHIGKGRTRIRIAKVDLATGQLVALSRPLKLGHANSLVFNRNLGLLLATGAKKKDPFLRLIDPEKLRLVGKVKVDTSKYGKQVEAFNALAYDERADRYYIRARGKKGKKAVFVLNNRFRAVAKYRMECGSNEVQGMAVADGKILLMQAMKQTSGKNTVTVYNNHCKKQKTYKLDFGGMGKGELESIFSVGDQWFGTVHKKFRKSGKQKKYKTTFVFRIKF